MRPAQARRNVELKATDPSPACSLEICRALGAEDRGVLEQRDTHFAVPHGGLKLREQSPGQPHLIQFDRADEPQQRLSSYRVIDVDDGPACSAALTAALGLRCVVVKRRQLFLWRGVRIHLDRVEGLGSFVEFEAVASPDSDLTYEHELVARLREAFAVTDDRLCRHGYAMQLLQST
jgi:adenylate cyclase, class 2